MKYIAVTFIAISLIALLGGCTKSREKKTISPGISAKVNGVPWTATTYSARLDTSGFLLIIGYVGSTSTGTNISVSISNYTAATGTFPISVLVNGAEYADHSIGAYHLATSGSITLTQASATNVEGIFHFTAAASFPVTDGQFNVPIR